MITDVTTMSLQATELAAIQRLVANQEPRAVLAVLQGALDQLNARIGAPFAPDIESRIVDAAVLFDCVADVRALVFVLDRDLRDLAMRLERFCDAMENGIASELRAPAA